MVAKKIRDMKDIKSPGVNGIPPKLQLEIVEQISIPLVTVFKFSLMYKEKDLIIPLYKTIVRPHLDYCIQAWRPYRKKDIDMLERVQRRVTQMIPKPGILVTKCV